MRYREHKHTVNLPTLLKRVHCFATETVTLIQAQNKVSVLLLQLWLSRFTYMMKWCIGSKCYCGMAVYTYSAGNPGDADYFSSGVKVDSSFCNTACAGDTTEYCGGTGYLSYAKAYDPSDIGTCKRLRSLEQKGKAFLRRHFHFVRKYPAIMDRWYKLEEEVIRQRFKWYERPDAPLYRERVKRMEERVTYLYDLHSRVSQSLWGGSNVIMGNVTFEGELYVAMNDSSQH